jgi:hypothetical protein
MGVPSSIAGLALFILLLAPGLTYLVQMEQRAPRPEFSPFRETVSVVLVSAIADLAAVIVFALVRIIRPRWTPDIGQLVRAPRPYFRSHYGSIGYWTIGLFVVACLVTWIVGRGGLRDAASRQVIEFSSAWWHLMNTLHPDQKAYVGCQLEDGSYLSGPIYRCNTGIEETADRELILSSPVTLRQVDASETDLGVGAVTISARRILYTTVTWIPKDFILGSGNEQGSGTADQGRVT